MSFSIWVLVNDVSNPPVLHGGHCCQVQAGHHQLDAQGYGEVDGKVC